MKVYVLAIDYYRTDSLWGDEYYPATDILRVYSDEERPKNLCEKLDEKIKKFINCKDEFRYEIHDEDEFDIIDADGETLYTIDRTHMEKVSLYYTEYDVV